MHSFQQQTASHVCCSKGLCCRPATQMNNLCYKKGLTLPLHSLPFPFLLQPYKNDVRECIPVESFRLCWFLLILLLKSYWLIEIVWCRIRQKTSIAVAKIYR